jgi:hypothetical protein
MLSMIYAPVGRNNVRIVVTEWGLQSYLDLIHSGTLTRREYTQTIRPDVEKLKQFPAHVDFLNSKFWGPAIDRSGKDVPNGFKMKWRNIGPGQIQLRGADAVLGSDAFLCQAYSKTSPAQDRREAAKLKNHIRDICLGNYQIRGVLP